jgi:hypothetical protein
LLHRPPVTPRTLRLLLAASLAGLTAAAFFPVLGAEFFFVDDGAMVWKNPAVLSGLSPGCRTSSTSPSSG